jgi:hypothetical protein
MQTVGNYMWFRSCNELSLLFSSTDVPCMVSRQCDDPSLHASWCGHKRCRVLDAPGQAKASKAANRILAYIGVHKVVFDIVVA